MRLSPGHSHLIPQCLALLVQELIPYKALFKLLLLKKGVREVGSVSSDNLGVFGMHLVLRALCARVPQWGGGAEEGAVGFSALGGILAGLRGCLGWDPRTTCQP